MTIQQLFKAAEGGDVSAMLSLAETFEAGQLLPRDIVAAVKWYKKSADKGNVRAMRKLADCYYFNKEVENAAEAVKYYTLAARKGEPKAAYNLGVFYQKGINVDVDIIAAFRYYLLAAERGRPEGAYKAGVMFLYGTGTKPNPERGFSLLQKSAESSEISPKAFYQIGLCYLNGLGTAADKGKAIYYLEKAGKQNYLPALTQLGDIFYAQNNKEKAKEYFVAAAQLDEPTALLRLANMAYNGDSVPADKETAQDLYSRAASLGNAEAEEKLKNWQ